MSIIRPMDGTDQAADLDAARRLLARLRAEPDDDGGVGWSPDMYVPPR